MPIRKVSTSTESETLVKRISGVGSGTTKVRRVTMGRPVSRVVQNRSDNIKTFDGLGDIPAINELKLGEIGINTQDGKVYIKREYDGGIQTIVEIGTGTDNLSATTTFNSYIYTSDGTLGVITGEDDSGDVLTYDPNTNNASRIQVYLNGVLLHQGIDYVADTGDSISLTHVVDDEQVVQVAAYNSTGVSLGNDLILDDHFAFTVGTNEETRFYHNGVDTIIKHLGFSGSKFKIQHLNDDRFIIDGSSVQLLGDYTLNGENITTQAEIDQLNTRLNSLDSDIQEIKSTLQQLV
jgi:predicted RNA-binding protein